MSFLSFFAPVYLFYLFEAECLNINPNKCHGCIAGSILNHCAVRDATNRWRRFGSSSSVISTDKFHATPTWSTAYARPRPAQLRPRRSVAALSEPVCCCCCCCWQHCAFDVQATQCRRSSASACTARPLIHTDHPRSALPCTVPTSLPR